MHGKIIDLQKYLLVISTSGNKMSQSSNNTYWFAYFTSYVTYMIFPYKVTINQYPYRVFYIFVAF
jgi:hypothetical protein